MSKKRMNILLVDDDDLDVEFLQRGLKKIGAEGDLLRARDGLDALEILEKHRQGERIPEPFIILLDINMPRMNGHEFLYELRQTEDAASSRVFIFTTSASEKDIDRAYDNHACGYIVKPNSIQDMSTILNALKHFWDTCEHPRGSRSTPVHTDTETLQPKSAATGTS